MLDRAKFMETLHAVGEIAQTSEHPLSKEEIRSYFKDMELTEEQLTMVYQHILLHPEPEQPAAAPEDAIDAPMTNEEKKTHEKNSKFLDMYLEDISHVDRLNEAEEEAAYVRLINGEEKVVTELSNHWLSEVVHLAKNYAAREVNMEDLIQEGNIGLVLGIQALLGRHEMLPGREYLKESVLKAMEDYIDEVDSDAEWIKTVLAKATLVYEATKALAEDLARIPTVRELSEYTRLPEDEIRDILRLSLETPREA